MIRIAGVVVAWLLACALSWGLAWALCAFIAWEPNPGRWNPVFRYTFAACLALWCVSIRVPLPDESKEAP